MEKIASFQINHTILPKGIYLSRIDGNIITYDIRMRKPNREPVISNAALHTIEHLFATYVRNSRYSNSVIYFGPMGCRTGCYFLLRDDVSKNEAIKLIIDAFEFISTFDDKIPGAEESECGNYLDHDLPAAREEAKEMLNILKDWNEEKLIYPTK